MFLKKFSLFNKLIIGLAVSIIALVSLLIVSYDTSEKLYKSFSWVEHSYKVQAQLETLILQLTKDESNTARFIYSGDERSLWEIQETSANINNEFKALLVLVKDHPIQVQRCQNLRGLFQKRLSYLYKSINLRKSKSFKQTDINQLMQEGSIYMSHIMLLKSTMEVEEENLMKMRQKDVFLHMVNTNISIYLAGLTSIGCIILILFIIYKERLKQLRIEEDLKALDVNKNKFFSIISHDLRNPARGIVKLTSFLKEENNSKEEVDKIVSLIENSSNRLVDLLENLLSWAKLQMDNNDFNPEPLNMQELVEQAVESLRINASLKEITIDNSVQNYTIAGDRNMILTTFRNIISNAIKFTHRKGNISVISEKVGKQINFFVKDNGIGMSEDIKESLFLVGNNKSSKGTANETGTGLGLLLCKEFVEKNKGTISVESEINKGSKFEISFPELTL